MLIYFLSDQDAWGMKYWALFLGIAVVSASIFGPIGSRIAKQKQRAPIEGLFLELIIGPLGTLAEVLLPNVRNRSNPSRFSLSDAWHRHYY